VLILSVETTCDETAVALVRDGREVLTDQIFSQAKLHAIYGGVVPEIASRSHVEVISQLADRAIEAAGISKKEIDAVAVSNAPGLIGAVLVGVSFAKAAAYALGVPLIPVHHIKGHIAANYLAFPELEPPFLCLAVSGGNTLLVDVRGYTDMAVLGGTRDDAAGECFDKVARVLGLPYPGGAPVDKLSQKGDDSSYPLPTPQLPSNPYDMSFSGLKTAVVNIVHNAAQKSENKASQAGEQTAETLDKSGLCASFVKAVSDCLVPRTLAAAEALGYKKIAVAGGVAANSRLRKDFDNAAKANNLELFIPPLRLCGDNAAMIGSQGYYEFLAGTRAGTELNGYANMEIHHETRD
jgi:N6-L-threonylcarbamoyladenine synthase